MRISDMLDDGLRVLLPDGTTQPLRRYLAPVALLLASAGILTVSLPLPYWSMDLTAPQYPGGLRVEVYVDHLAGDVAEIDELNHYLGLPPLDEGGRVERRIAVPSMAGIAALTLVAILVRNRWSMLLVLPMIAFPFAFLADLWRILYTYGHGIDPASALGGAVDPFTPPLFGAGQVGQFGSTAQAEVGLYLAFLAAVLALAGMLAHRAAYTSIQNARQRANRLPSPSQRRRG